MKINPYPSFLRVFFTTIGLAVIIVFQMIIFGAQDSKVILKEPMACSFDMFQQDVDQALLDKSSAATEVKCGTEYRAISWLAAKFFAIEMISNKSLYPDNTLPVVCSQFRWRWKNELINDCQLIKVESPK